MKNIHTFGANRNAGAVAALLFFAVVLIAVMALIIAGVSQSDRAEAATVDGDAIVTISSGDTTTTEDNGSTEEAAADNTLFGKAIGATIGVGLAATGAAIAMGMAVSKTNEATARQPELQNKLSSNMMLGFVFIETVVIYTLIVGILVIFVL